jgi:hypothetical protein
MTDLRPAATPDPVAPALPARRGGRRRGHARHAAAARLAAVNPEGTGGPERR